MEFGITKFIPRSPVFIKVLHLAYESTVFNVITNVILTWAMYVVREYVPSSNFLDTSYRN
jgi:hypothetical protein